MKHNYTSSNGLQETQGTKLNVNVPRNSWTDPTGEMRNEKLKMKNCHAGEVSREDAKTQSYAKQIFSTMMRSCCGHVAVRSSQSLLRYATVVLMCLFVGVGNAWGETTAAVNEVLWQEQFTGTTTSTSTTFSASNATAISGVANSSKGTSMLVTADISKIAYTASNVMLTASTGTNCSGAHIWINKSTTGYFQVTGIPLYGANKVKVSWAQGGASKITVQYSFDGSTNFTELSSNSSASAEFTSTELNTSGHTTISLKFVRTSTSTNIRLDNLKLFVTEAGANKTPLSTPAVITNIAESDITTTTTIRWGSVSGAANYELVVKQGSTEKFKKSDIAGTETSYTVTGLTASTAYMATVKALAGSSTTNSDSEVSNDVSWTTAAPAQRTITWLVNDNAWTEGSPTTSVEDGSKPTTLPTPPASTDCDGSKVFVGWTAQDNVSSDERPSDLFKTVAPEITRDVTFRAVFATKVGAGQDAPTAFFEETFKAAGNSTVVFSNSNLSASQNMFVDKTADVVSHYSGVGKQSNSTNTNAGKTGSCCYSQANSASTINALTISGIDISGKSNLQLHFWCKRNGTNKSGNVKVNVTAKIDDGAVVALLTNEDRTDDANWYERTLDISGTGTSLTLSFSYTTAGGYQCLFDDIEVLGTDGGYENYTISCSCDHEFWWGYPNESGEYVCFTQVGNTNEWQTANITIPAYEWNGSKEMYYNVSNLDNNRTQNIKFYRLRFAHSADKCNVTYDGADNHTVTAEGPKPGAYGKIRMFDNYSDKNGFAAFIPNGYKLKLGSDEVELNLVANTEGKEWQTAILELTAARINNTIEAGVTDAEGGFIGVNSFGTAQTIAASNLGQKTNATTWGANLSAADAGKHGVFRIWLDHCAKNWDVHFVPYYRLNYNANGGSGEEMASTDWVSCEADDDARKVSVTACTFTAPENKRFKEWNTQADGNGTTVAVGDYTLTSETTLYAIWEDIPTYTITWQWDGGYTTTTGQINTAVETSTIPTAATCDDNIFVGWVAATYTKQADKPTTIDVSELTYTANVTYHALYGLVDGVSQVTDANEIVDGGEYMFVITDNTNTYALKQGSPNTVSNGKVTAVSAGTATITATAADGQGASATCKVTVKYELKYQSNGGAGAAAPEDELHGNEEVIVKDNVNGMTKTCYVFSGWNTKADGTGEDYAVGRQFTMTGNLTLYAKWLPKTYTVTWQVNADEEWSTTTQVLCGDNARPTLPTLPNTVVCTAGGVNKVFMGWVPATVNLSTPVEDITTVTDYFATDATGDALPTITKDITFQGVWAEAVTTPQAAPMRRTVGYSTDYTYSVDKNNLVGILDDNHTEQNGWIQVPASSGVCWATIPDVFAGYIINSNVVITIEHAKYGNGNNPTAATFSIYNDLGEQVTATPSGTLASNSDYQNVVYTISQAEATAKFTNGLKIKIDKASNAYLRLKSIKVTYTPATPKVTVSPTTLNMVVEGEATLTATNTSDINGSYFSGWTSSNDDIVMVTDHNGTCDLLAISAGDAVVTVTLKGAWNSSIYDYDTYTATCTVHVTEASSTEPDPEDPPTPTITYTNYTTQCSEKTWTVTFMNDITSVREVEVANGQTIADTDIPTGLTACDEYTFKGWTTAEQKTPVEDIELVDFNNFTITENTTLYAVWGKVELSDRYQLISKENIETDKNYVLTVHTTQAGAHKWYAMQAAEKTGNDNKRYLNRVDVTQGNEAPSTDNTITITDPKLIWNIQTKNDGYSLYNETAGKYAKISGSNSNNLILSDAQQFTYTAHTNRTPIDVDFGALNRQISYSTSDKVWYAASSNNRYLYLYQQQENLLFTTSPRCGAKLAAIGNVQVVSGAGITIQGTQEITITGTQLATSTNLRVNNVSNSHFAVVWTSGTATGTNNLPITPTDGNVTATFAVTYTPTTDNYNTTEECEITILAGSQSATPATCEAMTKIKVYGYCLPERFAIVGEAGGQTFALPNNMNTAGTYMGIPVTFAEEGYTLENAPAEVVYTAGIASTTTIDSYNTITDKANRLKLLNGDGTAALWEGTTGIKNATLGDGLKSVVTMWKVTTIDEFQTFNIVDKDGTALSIATGNTSYRGRFGQYTSGASQNLQIVPIAEPTCHFYPTPAVKVTNVTYNSATFAVTKPAGYPQYASVWQYTFTPENTESWTALTDLTINDLESETDYTIYVKAFTTDVVCEDNIASCDFRTLPAPLAACEGAPNNLRATVGPNTAHLEWNANGNNGKIFHIQIWSDELRQEPLGEELTTEAGVTSKDVSGLIEGKEYWWQVYVTAANGDKCASTVASFITNNNAFDIVEWKEDAVVIEPWIDGVVTAAIEQKETGQTAQAAEELFFSKYFEAMSNVKLLGLYNGTNADIDLDGYVVKIARRGSKNPPQSADWADLVDLGSKQETLETGKEMILISYHMTDATDLDLIKCAQENSTSGFSNYIVCGQTIDFNGDDAIALFKDGEMIDIIGAGDATQGNFVSCQPATTAAFMDSPGGWYCANGDNIETKTVVEQDYALSTNRCLLVRKNTVTSGQTAVESNETDFATLCTEWAGKQIPKNAADGGKNATCEGFDYVGSFDYNEYYSTYTPLGETNLGSNANGDGTYTISIPQLKYEDGKPNKIACTNIRINLMGEGNAVLASQVVKVPIMITPNTNTQPVANNKFVETKIMDGEGNYVPIVESYDVTLIRDRAENSPLKNYEVCKDCDIVILDGGVLQVRADIETEPVSTYYCGEHPEGHAIYLEARDVDVYAGGRIVLDNDVLFNTLTIHALDDEVGTANLQNFLHLTDNDGLHHAKRFTGKRWYYFSLPYDCYIEDVTFLNSNKAEYWKDWYLFTYDGKQRAQYAQNGGFVDDYTNFWQVWEQPYIKAGIGYLLGIEERFETDGTNKHIYRQLNFPMAVGERRNDNTIMQYDVSSNNNANANGNDAKRLENIGAWGAINAEQTRENNVGWNMIGMPYLDYYIPTRGVNGAKELVEHALTNSAVGAELITWKVNNNDLEFTPENISVIRYPVYNVNNDDIDHFTERSTDITLIDENFVMKPFLAYLVQAPGHDGNGDGQINQEDNFVIEFVPAGLMDNIDPSSNAASIRRIYYEDLPQNGAEAMQVNIDLRLTNANGKSGKTVIKLNDWNSDDYEVGKEMTASWGRINQPFLASQQVGGAGQGDRLSIQYLPDSSVVNLPIYYRANQAGELTFSLARFTSFTYLDHLYLFDTQENIHTDLLQFDYTFTTEQGDFATRFYLTAEVNRTPQVVDNLNDSNLGVRISGDKSSLTLYGMPINVMVWIYNAEGKLCYAGQAATSTMQYDIPSAGVYYVRLQTAQAKQTLVTIVK